MKSEVLQARHWIGYIKGCEVEGVLISRMLYEPLSRLKDTRECKCIKD